MGRIGKLLPLLAISGWLVAARAPAQDTKAPDTKVAPAEQYQALLREFQQSARGLWEATTDEQRTAVAERMAGLSVRCLDWAEHNLDEPLACDCLVQVVQQEIWLENNTLHPGRAGESLEGRAIALLLQHFLQSPGLAECCTRMSYGFHPQCEVFLRAVLAGDAPRDVKGVACLRLAQFLNSRLRRLDLLGVRPEMNSRYEVLFGKPCLEELRRQDRSAVLAEIETIFERAAREFADTKLPWDRTVGEVARSELHEMQHLSVGKEALELEGLDQDGAPIKLSDYRGKVVLLYFWSEH